MAESADGVTEKNVQHQPCPMTRFVSLVSGKWAIPILYRLIVLNAPVRFGELLRAAAPITQKELTKQLRLFELRRLVSRTVYPEIPPRVEYQITPLGLTMHSALAPLADWMRENGDKLNTE
ncbi:winged helix-turn-helix transcriptional regulator [Citrobacter amalonaticus]|uniref:winged helix-turn-helix transcriptional regulator n=1 Tax=Citrobacter amalonaticus TaxID=35703 RepID=UPI000733A02A|nr:helix-turn-helix domain-containing protein [Citrobacter amalonaticus]EKX8497365.1 helix-turn-helix transcriptional regulator [Citrobacter amalonaticus]ELO0856458.1 helix-turn-helix transcriptional regulator [Citrobacter amalonaticus]PNP36642.1 transcriptional regulator [Citrobacter amalonaticus]